MKTKIIEQCPKCLRPHEQGEYLRHNIEDRIFASPDDIICSCGLTLRWSVPFFKTNKSGYILRVKNDQETPRFGGTPFENL